MLSFAGWQNTQRKLKRPHRGTFDVYHPGQTAPKHLWEGTILKPAHGAGTVAAAAAASTDLIDLTMQDGGR